VKSWRKDGRDCYYGRYQFTFRDGATESGNIVWPFCYDRSVDPFTHPARPMPFPLPLVGFKLPADAQMPPIEKRASKGTPGRAVNNFENNSLGHLDILELQR
jgi:hypothetical protein